MIHNPVGYITWEGTNLYLLTARKSHAMFADTLTLTLNTVAKTLTRVDGSGGRGIFRNTAEGLKVTLTQSETKAKRGIMGVRIDHEKLAADPLLTGVNQPASASVRLTADYPALGYTLQEKEDHLEALADWLKVQANRDKLLNGEV